MKFLSELILVYIKGDYFRYISSFDQNIYYDENNPNYPKKPHLGLLMENNGMLYVIPLTSAKPKHIFWKDNGADYIKIYEIVDLTKDRILTNDVLADIKNQDLIRSIPDFDASKYKQKILSILDMRKMFPVKKGVFENAEISMGGNTELRRRSGLLIKELLFLKSRKSEIEKKADKIYKKQTLTGKVNRGYTNFSILEKACENYIAK